MEIPGQISAEIDSSSKGKLQTYQWGKPTGSYTQIYNKTAQMTARGETGSGVGLNEDAKVISLCRDRGCINPDHHLTGTDFEARVFGPWGHLGAGDLWYAKRLVASGQMTTSGIAYAWQVSEPIIVNGIARCA